MAKKTNELKLIATILKRITGRTYPIEAFGDKSSYWISVPLNKSDQSLIKLIQAHLDALDPFYNERISVGHTIVFSSNDGSTISDIELFDNTLVTTMESKINTSLNPARFKSYKRK